MIYALPVKSPQEIEAPRRSSRCAAGRPGRGQHDLHRGSPRPAQEPRGAHRLAVADGHRAARQTDRGTLAADSRFRAAGRTRRSGVRRLGHLRGRLLRGGPHRRRAGRGAARANPARARSDSALAGRLRAAVREAPERSARQARRQQARAGRAGGRRYPPLPGDQSTRSARPRVVRQHRGLHGGSAGASVAGRVRGRAGAIRSGHPVEHDLRLRGNQGRHSVRQRGAQSQRRRAGPDRARRRDGRTARGQGSQDGADPDQDDRRTRPQGAPAGGFGLVLDQHPRQPRRRGPRRSGIVQDEGGEQEVGSGLHLAAGSVPDAVRRPPSRRAVSTTIRRAATTRRAGTTSTWSDGSGIRCS